MNFKKYLIAGLLLLLLTACGTDTKELDVNTLSEDIVAAIEFEDELALIPDDIALNIYGFDKESVVDINTYVGSGATAEEVTVVKFESLTDAEKQLLEERIEKQITSYETYIPAEIERIENNVILYSEDTAVLCVSKDKDNAKDIIENLMY